MGIVALGTLAMAISGMDILSAFTGTLSCVGNIGPAFGTLGPRFSIVYACLLEKI